MHVNLFLIAGNKAQKKVVDRQPFFHLVLYCYFFTVFLGLRV